MIYSSFYANFFSILYFEAAFCSDADCELVTGPITKIETVQLVTEKQPFIQETEDQPVFITLEKNCTDELLKPNLPTNGMFNDREVTKNSLFLEKDSSVERENNIGDSESLNSKKESSLLESELIRIFKELNSELSQVTKFYDYYDVLTFVDKSIALIEEFKNTAAISRKYHSMRYKRKILKIGVYLGKLREMLHEVKDNYAEKEKKQYPIKFRYVKHGLFSVKKRQMYYEEQFNIYKENRSIIDEYHSACYLKFVHLDSLLCHLKDIKTKICPLGNTVGTNSLMKEKNLDKLAEYFKNEFKTIVLGVYEDLYTCHEKEKQNLNWFFEVLDDIFEGIKNSIFELKAFQKILVPKDKREKMFLWQR